MRPPEQVRLEHDKYISSTLAATTAKICYSYFSRLCVEGKGPEEHVILFHNRKFFPLREVKRWAKARAWVKPVETRAKGGRKAYVDKFQGIELNLQVAIVKEFREKFPTIVMSHLVNRLLKQFVDGEIK